MRKEVQERLRRLNLEFYQNFTEHFAETRTRLQPGVLKILAELPLSASVLDLGCGHGVLAKELYHRGHKGIYVGIDNSSALLEIARREVSNPRIEFLQADLANDNWIGHGEAFISPGEGEGSIRDTERKILHRFDRVLAFASLHHIPGEAQRLKVVQQISKLTIDKGLFIHSNWNFMASERLRQRVVPWEEIGLSDRDVELGDFLVDWRRGGRGLRYVHHFDEAQLEALAEGGSFTVHKSYFADGGLGLYQIWKKLLPS